MAKGAAMTNTSTEIQCAHCEEWFELGVSPRCPFCGAEIAGAEPALADEHVELMQEVHPPSPRRKLPYVRVPTPPPGRRERLTEAPTRKDIKRVQSS